MTIPVIMFGTGELPKTIHSYLTYAATEKFDVIAFTCDEAFIPESKMFMDRPVIPFAENDLENFAASSDKYRGAKLCLPVGYKDCNRLKEKKYVQAKSWGFEFITYVHPSVQLFPDVEIGENTIILENNTIQPGVKIGPSCVIWSSNHVGHSTTIGSSTWLASGITISGQCQVGERVFMGVNCCVRDRVTIADDCIIGMGAVITKNTKAQQVYLTGANNLHAKPSTQVAI